MSRSRWTQRLYEELASTRLQVRVDGPGATPLLSNLLYLHQQLSGGNPAFAGLRAVHLLWPYRGGG